MDENIVVSEVKHRKEIKHHQGGNVAGVKEIKHHQGGNVAGVG